MICSKPQDIPLEMEKIRMLLNLSHTQNLTIALHDHVHIILIKIPLKYAVSEVIGYIKGKSAIAVAR